MDFGLLVGARGGIGSAMLALLEADDSVRRIEACHRIPCTGEAGTSGREHCSAGRGDGKVAWRTLDLECNLSIQRNAQELQEKIPHLDFLICAAGLLHDEDLQPEKRMQQIQSQNLQRLFQVNAAGPLSLLAALEPLLQQAAAPKIMFLSAQVGSIEDNHLGGWYSYRMSKAALNMGLKTASIEMSRWRNEPVLMAVHPGTTYTPLSDPFTRNRKAPVRTAEETADHLHRLLKSAGPDHHGGFFTAAGDRLPW